jgi:hypothetical protein
MNDVRLEKRDGVYVVLSDLDQPPFGLTHYQSVLYEGYSFDDAMKELRRAAKALRDGQFDKITVPRGVR